MTTIRQFEADVRATAGTARKLRDEASDFRGAGISVMSGRIDFTPTNAMYSTMGRALKARADELDAEATAAMEEYRAELLAGLRDEADS